MSNPSPAFLVDGSVPSGAVAVAYGSTHTFSLVSLVGVDQVEWTLQGRSHTTTSYPAITTSGVAGSTASITFPANPGDGQGRGFILQAKINGGLDPITRLPNNATIARIVVGCANSNGIVPLVPGETTERNAETGWAGVLNPFLAIQGPTGPAGPSSGGIQSTTALNASTYLGGTLTLNKDASQHTLGIGDQVKLTSRSVVTDWCSGVVTSVSGTSLGVVINVNAGANATHTDWNVAITGATAVGQPGASGNVLQSNGTSWVSQQFLRTPAAIAAALSGAIGFLRGADNDTFISTRRSATDYSLVSTDTTGNGGGLVLGNLGLGVLKLLAGNKTVTMSSTGVDLGALGAKNAADPAADTDLTTRGYEAACVNVTDTALVAARNVVHSHAETSITTDLGAYGLTYTVAGSPTLNTSVKKFGASSLAIGNSTANYIYVDMPAGMKPFGVDDLTIECWVYVIAATANTVQAFLYGNNGATDQTGFMLAVNSSGYLQFAQADVQVSGTSQVKQWGAIITDGTLFTSRVGYGTWAHLAAVRYNGTWCLYVNGVSVGTPVQRGAYPSLTFTRFHVGIHPTLSGTVNGYVDEWRVRREAVYTAAFTAPSAAFADRTSIATAKRKGEIRWYNGTPYICTDSTNGLWLPLNDVA